MLVKNKIIMSYNITCINEVHQSIVLVVMNQRSYHSMGTSLLSIQQLTSASRLQYPPCHHINTENWYSSMMSGGYMSAEGDTFSMMFRCG